MCKEVVMHLFEGLYRLFLKENWGKGEITVTMIGVEAQIRTECIPVEAEALQLELAATKKFCSLYSVTE
jgi:hypothetical protein